MSAMACIIRVPTLFVSHASFSFVAIFPIRIKTCCAILSMVDNICVPVPFVHTSRRLLPTLFAKSPMLESAYFAASIVFFPSACHASLNGLKRLAKVSFTFCRIGMSVISTSSKNGPSGIVPPTPPLFPPPLFPLLLLLCSV